MFHVFCFLKPGGQLEQPRSSKDIVFWSGEMLTRRFGAKEGDLTMFVYLVHGLPRLPAEKPMHDRQVPPGEALGA
jgi:hypothetical protein